MDVLIAPHDFGPLLPSRDAAQLLAQGWSGVRPDDRLRLVPLSDGSAGFLEAMTPLGELDPLTVVDELRADHPIAVVRTEAATAYVTTTSWSVPSGGSPAQAPDLFRTDSWGVGQALARLIRTGTRRIVLAAGQVPWHDAGSGFLIGLARGLGIDTAITGDAAGAISSDVAELLPTVRGELVGIELLLAAQNPDPLLGLHGAGAALINAGVTAQHAQQVEARTHEFIAAVESHAAAWAPIDLLGSTDRRLSRRPYSGVGGGVGFLLTALGARALPAAWVISEELQVNRAVESVDMALTGALVLADTELSGGVVADLAERAAPWAIPVVAIGGRIDATWRQLATVGVHGTYPVLDTAPGELPELDGITPAALVERGARVARSWSR